MRPRSPRPASDWGVKLVLTDREVSRTYGRSGGGRLAPCSLRWRPLTSRPCFPYMASAGLRDVDPRGSGGNQGLMMNGRQLIPYMQGLTKAYPGGQEGVREHPLSFFPDAKIGVVGVNGSGKSTLLKIMAGLTRSSPARLVAKAPAWATWSRSRNSMPPKRCARTSWKGSPKRRRSSTATTRSHPTTPKRLSRK